MSISKTKTDKPLVSPYLIGHCPNQIKAERPHRVRVTCRLSVTSELVVTLSPLKTNANMGNGDVVPISWSGKDKYVPIHVKIDYLHGCHTTWSTRDTVLTVALSEFGSSFDKHIIRTFQFQRIQYCQNSCSCFKPLELEIQVFQCKKDEGGCMEILSTTKDTDPIIRSVDSGIAGIQESQTSLDLAGATTTHVQQSATSNSGGLRCEERPTAVTADDDTFTTLSTRADSAVSLSEIVTQELNSDPSFAETLPVQADKDGSKSPSVTLKTLPAMAVYKP